MRERLFRYVNEFNAHDGEYYKQDVPNALAAEFLLENIPLIDIPDKEIERIYYFRYWSFRKHIKSTEDGMLITEFLPPVPWAGKHNAIVAAAGHHIAEGRWLKCGRRLIEDYAAFWLSGKGASQAYGSWLLYAIYEYCRHVGDDHLGVENLSLMCRYYEEMESAHRTECGLLWSVDGEDAMEFSISGADKDLNLTRGLRPSLNCYMAASALAIAYFAEKAGEREIAARYREKHEVLKEKINTLLFDGEFYKAIHNADLSPDLEKLPDLQNARELVGYIPWCFLLPPEGRERAFAHLKTADGFLSPIGLCTAERRHPRYLYPVRHECLWNGYVWPFATSQTLRAVENLLHFYSQSEITREDYYAMLLAYARSHRRRDEDGRELPWIDEVMHPETGEWSSREIMKNGGWKKELGGFERGKDYNHSTFCDHVLSGLLGIGAEGGRPTVSPLIPKDWEYFAVENLYIGDRRYRVIYDKTGEKYGRGKGISVFEISSDRKETRI